MGPCDGKDGSESLCDTGEIVHPCPAVTVQADDIVIVLRRQGGAACTGGVSIGCAKRPSSRGSESLRQANSPIPKRLFHWLALPRFCIIVLNIDG